MDHGKPKRRPWQQPNRPDPRAPSTRELRRLREECDAALDGIFTPEVRLAIERQITELDLLLGVIG